MRQAWRHDIVDHGDAFRAIAVILQTTINGGEKLFSVDYRDEENSSGTEISA